MNRRIICYLFVWLSQFDDSRDEVLDERHGLARKEADYTVLEEIPCNAWGGHLGFTFNG